MKTKIYLHKGDNNQVLKKTDQINPNIIYMDPPYNTWNSSLLYSDSTPSSDWQNNFEILIRNLKTISQKNCTFFISIGVEELANVIHTVKKILGRKSIISVMPRRTHSGHKTSKTILLQHDFVVVAKKGNVEFNGIDFNLDAYKLTDEYVDDRGKYQKRRLDYKTFKWSKSLDYKIKFENKIFYPGGVTNEGWKERKENHTSRDWCWLWSEKRVEFAIKEGFLIFDGKYVYKKTYTKAQISKDENGCYYVENMKRTKKVDSLNFVDNAYALKKSRTNPEMLFDYPKSDELVEDLLSLPKVNEMIVLDPFGGTGTTAIASNKLNAKEVHIIQMSEKPLKNSPAEKAGYKDIYELTKDNIETRLKVKVKEL